RTRKWIQAGFTLQCSPGACQRDGRATAEFDAEVPAGARIVGPLHQNVRNHFPWLARKRPGVGTRGASPAVAITQRIEMRAGRRGRVGSFFHPEALELRVRLDRPVESQARL